MSEPQKVQLTKGKRDTIIDGVALAVFTGMVYFVLNPEKYDRMTDGFTARVNKITHRLSVWQTKLSIRPLPETDDS